MVLKVKLLAMKIFIPVILRFINSKKPKLLIFAFSFKTHFKFA